MEEGPVFLYELDDRGICLEDVLTLEFLYLGGECTPVIDRCVYVQAVFQSDLVVLLSVSRCYVHASRTLLDGHERGKDDP